MMKENSFLLILGPPAPRNVEVVESTSNSLLVHWSSPSPTHGSLRSYDLQYWSKSNLGQPDVINIGVDESKYNLTDLKVNTSYGIQVTWSCSFCIYRAQKVAADVANPFRAFMDNLI